MARAAPPDLHSPGAALRVVARSYPRGLFIEPHAHDWGQLLYAMSGIMWVETPGEAVLVPPLRAVWLPPQVPHGVRVVSELEMRNIYLRPDQPSSLPATTQVLEVRPLLRELILGLVAQQADEQSEYYRSLSALAVLELQRAQHSHLRVPLPDAGDRRLFNLCQAVIASPSQAFSFEQHAAAVGASVRTLARLFQASLGMGFAEWRRQVQLATAVAELIEGTPVSRIAADLGYRPSSFSDMFRRELGVAPSEYLLSRQAP